MRLVVFLLCGIAGISTAQSQSPACPGDLIAYSCSSIVQHVWRGSAFSGQCPGGAPSDELSISINSLTTDDIGETVSCGVFTAIVTNITNVTNSIDEISSNLTFNASFDLDGLAVECSGGDFMTTVIHIFDLPVFPDSVMQDRSQDRENRTTVINWQPATVSRSGVTYDITDMTDDDVTVVINYNNTNQTAVVIVPEFNVPYIVCIEAFNDCGIPSGTPSCTTVVIEAEVAIISAINIGLVCSMAETKEGELIAQEASVMWIVDRSRNGNILRPPITRVNLSCEQEMAQGLLPSDTEFMFTSADYPACFSSSQAEFSLELENAGGNTSRNENIPISVIEIPESFNRDSTVFLLNAGCSESPSDFNLHINYSCNIAHVVTESQFNSDVNGFEVSFQELEPNVIRIEYELIMLYRGNAIGSLMKTATVNSIESVDTLFAVTVSILSLIVVVLMIVLVTTNMLWCYNHRKFKVISRITNDIELQTEKGPVYEDVSELPQPSSHEIFTEQNQAYGPVKSS